MRLSSTYKALYACLSSFCKVEDFINFLNLINPTGQGTGLGLSLSYDIIKAHRGEIKVETKEGEGAEFVIKLPG
jgi:signal transduction histidine kinase